MRRSTRRDFLSHLAGAAALLPLRGAGVQFTMQAARAQPAAYDLLIAGGRVVDPARQFSGEADVAIAAGRIAQVAPGIPRDRARRVVDATGRLVAPGLIDVHGHVYDEGIPISADPDSVGVSRGVTTIVDGGSTGAATFAGFRRYVIARARTRVYALLNISAIGLVVTNEIYLDPRMIDAKAAIAAIQANRDLILGLKVRVTGRDQDVAHDVGVLKTARAAADEVGLPIMLHWTNEPRLLALLRKGDILTHPFNPPQAGPSCIGPDGKVLPQILELRDRGIFTDFAHGTHLLWETAEQAARQGWFPDLISTDIHRAHLAPSGTVVDLTTTLSKFVLLGLTVDQVIEKVTAAPARAFRFPERIGTMEPGAVADVSILGIEEGTFELLDSTRQPRGARRRIVPVATIRSGELV
jgi:dihydroorotase